MWISGVCGSVSVRSVGFLQQGSAVDVREEQKYILTAARQTKTSEEDSEDKHSLTLKSETG